MVLQYVIFKINFSNFEYLFRIIFFVVKINKPGKSDVHQIESK